MNTITVIPEILGSFLPQIPTLLICAVACILIAANWRGNSRAALWAMLGFGLALVLCFAVPIVQAVVRHALMPQGGSPAMASVFSGLAFFWSLLRAASYVFLLLAVLAGRSQNSLEATPRP